MDKYRFGRSFRLKLLSLLLDPIWISRYGFDLIKPEYFDREDEESVAGAILEYYRRFGKVPSDPEDVIVLCSAACEEFVYELFDLDADLDLAYEEALKFAREQAAKLAILDSIDDVNKGDLQSIISRMEDVLAVGEKICSPGIDLLDDVDKWLYDIWKDKVATGWYHVDTILEGGLGPGELGLVMAPTNRGKSMALVNIGYGAAGIGSGKNVVHLTHEMSAAVVSKRYAARMMFRFPNANDNLGNYEKELRAAARKLMIGRVRVIGLMGSTLQEVGRTLERLRAEGFLFNVIIDDYPDLLESPRHYSDRRFELTDIYKGLRDLGAQNGVPVWGATHSNRASYSKEIITMQDVAEDIGKARIADVIVALCQTMEEEEVGRCRLFMAKVRDGKKHSMISAKFYGDSQAIVTTGILKRKEKRDLGADV